MGKKAMLRLLFIILGWFGLLPPLSAKPFASDLFCKAYPDSPACAGTALRCSYCHAPASQVPNLFGATLLQYMRDHNLSYPTTVPAMQEVIEGAGAIDADEDGFSNLA